MTEEDNTTTIIKRRREIRSSEQLDSDEKAVADFKKLKEEHQAITKKQQDGNGVNICPMFVDCLQGLPC